MSEAWDRPNNLFPRANVPPHTKHGAPSINANSPSLLSPPHRRQRKMVSWVSLGILHEEVALPGT